MNARFITILLGSLLFGGVAPYAFGGSLSARVLDQDGAPVDDAVLYVVSIDGETPPSSPLRVDVDQVNETFVPHVRATTVGSLVNFPNADDIRHHVYSFSDAKTFEVPLYIGTPAEPIRFDRPGIVSLGCNIHDHMLGYILILDTPHFSEVRQGEARLDTLPGGSLELELWHPRLIDSAVVQRSVVLGPDENAELSFTIDLRPERKVRRAPRRSGGSRY